MQNVKCVVIGSKAVGKSSLLNAFVGGTDSEISPFDRYNGMKVGVQVDGIDYNLELWDTECE